MPLGCLLVLYILPIAKVPSSHQQEEKEYLKVLEAASHPKLCSAHLKSSTGPYVSVYAHAHVVTTSVRKIKAAHFQSLIWVASREVKMT